MGWLLQIAVQYDPRAYGKKIKIDLFCQRDYTDIETPIDNLGFHSSISQNKVALNDNYHLRGKF